ncbi:Hypothetical predicted protein, partial [Paramuricea clavata]
CDRFAFRRPMLFFVTIHTSLSGSGIVTGKISPDRSFFNVSIALCAVALSSSRVPFYSHILGYNFASVTEVRSLNKQVTHSCFGIGVDKHFHICTISEDDHPPKHRWFLLWSCEIHVISLSLSLCSSHRFYEFILAFTYFSCSNTCVDIHCYSFVVKKVGSGVKSYICVSRNSLRNSFKHAPRYAVTATKISSVYAKMWSFIVTNLHLLLVLSRKAFSPYKYAVSPWKHASSPWKHAAFLWKHCSFSAETSGGNA